MNHTQLAIDVFNRRADLYQEKFMDVSLYHDSLDVFCSNLPAAPAEVLDAACGPGNVARYLLQQRPADNLTGIDLAPNMVALARQNNPTANFAAMDCRLIAKQGKLYDGIVCAFGFPYLSKEEAIGFIADAASILRPNGLVYLSTMEGAYSSSRLRRSSSGEDELYMFFHEAEYLIEAMQATGLSVVLEQRKEYTGADGSAVVDLILIGKKNKA